MWVSSASFPAVLMRTLVSFRNLLVPKVSQNVLVRSTALLFLTSFVTAMTTFLYFVISPDKDSPLTVLSLTTANTLGPVLSIHKRAVFAV
jgi:hypothetical protein